MAVTVWQQVRTESQRNKETTKVYHYNKDKTNINNNSAEMSGRYLSCMSDA